MSETKVTEASEKMPKTPPCPINGEQLSLEHIPTIEEENQMALES